MCSLIGSGRRCILVSICLLENLRRAHLLQLLLAPKLEVDLVAFACLAIGLEADLFVVVEAQVVAACVEHLLLRVQLRAPLLELVGQLVEHICRLVLQVRLLQEHHYFLLCLWHLDGLPLRIVSCHADLVFLQNVDDLLELCLTFRDLVGGLEHILARTPSRGV